MSAGMAIASAVGPIIGGVMGAASTRKAQKRALRYEKAMFDYTSAYNTPLNQRLRLEAAGLNPALMYEGGSISNVMSNPGAPANAGEPVNYLSGLPEVVNAFMQYALMDKQRELIDSNIDKNKASAVNIGADTRLKDFKLSEAWPVELANLVSRTDLNKFSLDKGQSVLPLEIENLRSETDKRKGEISLNAEREIGVQLDNWAKEVKNSNLKAKEYLTIMRMKSELVSMAMERLYRADQGANVREETKIKEFENKLNKQGASQRSLHLLQILTNILFRK